MWLLLCDRSDRSALWAFRALRARGLALELVTTSVLMCALTWEHRLSSQDTVLITLPYRSSSSNGKAEPTDQRLLISGNLVGPAPDSVRAGCQRLAETAGTAILGIEFAADGSWAFVGATPHPDLRIGGMPGIELLAEALSAE
jgi:hypothetical protein